MAIKNYIVNVLIIVIMLLALVESMNILEVKMSIDYFEFKNIKDICAISCFEDQDTIELTRQAANKGMFMRNVKMAPKAMDQNDRHKLTNMCWKQHVQPIGILIESSCQHFEEIMILASEEFILSPTHQWLIIQKEWTKKDSKTSNNTLNLTCDDIEQADEKTLNNSELIMPKTIDVLNKLNISVDVDMVLAVETEPTSYKLFDLFNFGRIQGGRLNIVNFGTWNKGLQVVLLENKLRRRRDFQRLGLRMLLVKTNPSAPFDPKRLTSKKPDPEINVMVQMSAAVLMELAEDYNIKFVFKAVDRWIGSFEPNVSRAVSTTLSYREADVSPVIRANSDLLAARLEFAQPPLVWYMSSKYYYRIPDSGIGKFENNFLSPLSRSVWMCVVFSLLLCVIVFLMSARLEQRPESVQYAVFSVWAYVCQQFFEDAAENVVQRISSARKVTMLITGLSCVLIYNYYTSSVVSNLLNGPHPSINSLEELADSPLQLILEANGISRSWLHTPNYTFNPDLAAEESYLRKKKILTKKPGDPVLVTLNEGVAMVKSGGYAFAAFEEGANARFGTVLDQREMCEIGSFYALVQTYVFPVLPYKGGYREFFVWSLTSFKERGIINSINQRVRSAEIKCVGTIPRALALGGAAPAFVLLGLGFVVAVAVLIGEIFEHRFSTFNKPTPVISKRSFLNKKNFNL